MYRYIILHIILTTGRRFKLVELHGTFRIHLQVRGLPKSVTQVMACYAVELMDNFGDFITPGIQFYCSSCCLPNSLCFISNCGRSKLLIVFWLVVGCNTSIKYPDYLSIWGTTRMPLYPRETFMSRFFSNKTGLSLRISLNVEPVENSNLGRAIHGSNSCEWILSR